MAKGKGWVAGETDKDNGSAASGHGTKGTMSDASWAQQKDDTKNQWDSKHWW